MVVEVEVTEVGNGVVTVVGSLVLEVMVSEVGNAVVMVAGSLVVGPSGVVLDFGLGSGSGFELGSGLDSWLDFRSGFESEDAMPLQETAGRRFLAKRNRTRVAENQENQCGVFAIRCNDREPCRRYGYASRCRLPYQ